MNLSMSKLELKNYIARQLDNFFPDRYCFDGTDVNNALDIALQRTEYCFKHINVSHYTRDGEVWFDHLHMDQFSAFIYFLANSLWIESENKAICDKLMSLNKVLNALFLSYKCKLPDIFMLNHAVGSFIGNADFADFLIISQNVTINPKFNSSDGPTIGKGVALKAGVSVVGHTQIGNGCLIETNTLLNNANVPDNYTAYTNEKGELKMEKNKTDCYIQQVFNVKIEV